MRQFSWAMYAVARLKSGVGFEQARVNLSGISQRLAQEYPKTTGGFAVMLPLTRHIAGDLRPALLMLSAAVLFLLLIACGNIASLLLVKAAGRGKEIAVRLAIGAGKARLVRQLMVESLVLSTAGGILGLFLAWNGVKFLVALLPKSASFPGVISVNGTALAFTAAIVLLATLSFGLAPALIVTKTHLLEAMKVVSHQAQGGGHQRLHRAMVIMEMSLAMVLLIGAGLMLRSMTELFRVNPGFDTHHLLTEVVYLNRMQTLKTTEIASIFDDAIRRVDALPGVESAAAVFPLPFANQIAQTYLAIKDLPLKPGEIRAVHYVLASGDYFRTLRIPLIAGREFTQADTFESLPVVLIDQELARRYWPDESPVGKRIKLFVQDFGDAKQKPLTIVGVVGTVKAGGLDADLGGDVYLPNDQHGNGAMTLVMRTRGAPLSLARETASVMHEVMPDSPVFRVQTMDQVVQQTQATRSLVLTLLAAFSIASLLMAVLGLYGVMSNLVSRRTNEIGIRMALGAQPGHVIRLILKQGVALVLPGVAIGLVISFALARVLASLLFDITTHDPATLAGVSVLLIVTALAACYIPARRAMRVDPLVALRYE